MTRRTGTKPPLPLHGRITCDAGAAVVTVTHTRPGVFHIQTTQGGVLDAWSRSYGDEITARTAATHVAVAFRAWGTAAAMDREADRLRFRVRDLLNTRRDVRQELINTEAALDAIADLNLWGHPALTALAA